MSMVLRLYLVIMFIKEVVLQQMIGGCGADGDPFVEFPEPSELCFEQAFFQV